MIGRAGNPADWPMGGNGELKGAVTVRAHKFSKTAEEKITKAGGKAEVL